jgi:hypothetical protein
LRLFYSYYRIEHDTAVLSNTLIHVVTFQQRFKGSLGCSLNLLRLLYSYYRIEHDNAVLSNTLIHVVTFQQRFKGSLGTVHFKSTCKELGRRHLPLQDLYPWQLHGLPTLCRSSTVILSCCFVIYRNKVAVERSQLNRCRPFIEPGTVDRIFTHWTQYIEK